MRPALSAALMALLASLSARVEQQRHRFDGVGFPLAAPRRVFLFRPDTSGNHQGSDTGPGREPRVGALLEQEAHRGQVGSLGRPQQRRRSGSQDRVGPPIELRSISLLGDELGVDIGAARQQPVDQVEARKLIPKDVRHRHVRHRQGVHVDGGEQRRSAVLVGQVRVGALLDQETGDIVMAVDDRGYTALVPSGSVTFRSAPASTSTRALSSDP